MNTRPCILGLCAVLLLGCGGGGRLDKEVGGHHISFVPPPGWEHFDYGQQQAFEREDARILMKDLGLRRPPERGGATLEEWLDYDLKRLDRATQRGLAARDSFTRDEHHFYVLDTWDRLTHEYRRRHVIIPDQGRHLAIYTEKGDWSLTRDTLDELVESLQFLEPLPVEEEDGTSASGDGRYPPQ